MQAEPLQNWQAVVDAKCPLIRECRRNPRLTGGEAGTAEEWGALRVYGAFRKERRHKEARDGNARWEASRQNTRKIRVSALTSTTTGATVVRIIRMGEDPFSGTTTWSPARMLS